MKIKDLEQKHINALVTGLYLVITKSMNIIPDMEQIRKDLNKGKPNPGRNYIQRSRLWEGTKQD